MRLWLDSLTITFRRGERQIDLSHHLTYVHGQVSSGKSSIARLVDFCLGGDLERTPALASELVAVTLAARVGDYDVVFQREAEGSRRVRMAWKPRDEERSGAGPGAALVPIAAGGEVTEIDGFRLENFSDYMFFLLGRQPIRVRRSKEDEESPLMRLGFRAFLPFCYLRQEDLDSSFMRFNKPFEGTQSRDVMRVVLGLYNERIAELEATLDNLFAARRGRQTAAQQVESFLEELGYDTAEELTSAIMETQSALARAEEALANDSFRDVEQPHAADDLRQRLILLGDVIREEQQALTDIETHLREQEELRAELITAKVRLFRSQRATELLSSQPFEHCPRCGALVKGRAHDAHSCELCLTPAGAKPAMTAVVDAETASSDIDARVAELDDSIERLRRAHAGESRQLEATTREKADADRELARTLAHYDSVVLARARTLERESARLRERSRSLEQASRIREAATRLKVEAADMEADIERARQDLDDQRQRLNPRQYIGEIEQAFLEALLTVGMPGVRDFDSVEVNPKTLVPAVVAGDSGLRWSFETAGGDVASAGSGGKKTLFHICYALALHRVCAENELDLPTLLIIDTPMKNIGEEVDAALFHGFYRYVYDLADGPLAETQIIIIDKEYEPTPDELDGADLLMTRDDPAHPPLVPYYVGP